MAGQHHFSIEQASDWQVNARWNGLAQNGRGGAVERL